MNFSVAHQGDRVTAAAFPSPAPKARGEGSGVGALGLPQTKARPRRVHCFCLQTLAD